MNSKLVLIGLLLVLFSTQVYALSDTNLVGYWNLDEAAGASLTDSVGGNTGALTGGAVNEVGKIGRAILLGINATDHVLLSNWRPSQNFSINFWIKQGASPVGNRIIGEFDLGSTNGGWLIDGGNSSGYGRFGRYYGGLVYTTSLQPWYTGSWKMITIVRDTNTSYIYVDTNLSSSTVSGTTISYVASDKFTFGALANGASWAQSENFYLDEVSTWNRVLTLSDINDLYNSGNGITYPFDEISFSYLANPEEGKVYLYDTSDIAEVITDWNWLVDGLSISTDQNTSFAATEFTDYNVCLIINDGNFSTCETINSGRFFGRGFIKIYDSLNNELDQVSYVISPAINGVSSGVLTDNNLDLNFTAITSSNYTFTFSKSSYTTLAFTMPLTQYTNFDYNFIMLDVNKTTNVNFQVFNESGAYAKTKTFYAYDYSLNKYAGIQTTDTLGRLTFNLDQTKSDYNFFSADFNFGTTIWTINKPKDIVTLSDINGTWEYSITGPSYSNASNIAAGIQKLLLQNTVYPYLIKIVDTNKNYASTTFGLKSVTSEKEKTLTPYLYKYANADLKLIKLIDFATNQPHSNPEELTLSLYTDNNGLIPIGIFINDSTGTYNIYMDENVTYELQVLSQSYNLRPTLDIYYLYLTEDIGIIIDNNLIVDVNAPIMDANLPIIFTQLREAVFGCSSTTDNCYPSMIFSLIAVALLLIVLAISGQIGAISQSITIGILLTMFLIIGFIPLWLYGVGVVILIAWGVFGQ